MIRKHVSWFATLWLAVLAFGGALVYAQVPKPWAVPTDEQLKSVPAPEAVIDWLRANAIPLNTVEAEHGFSDMQPLKAVVGNARIVALGEATHGTREFFQLKHRMLEFLVTEMGFNIFAMEANMPEAQAINQFVLEGRGDPAAALAGLVLLDLEHARSPGHDPLDAPLQSEAFTHPQNQVLWV